MSLNSDKYSSASHADTHSITSAALPVDAHTPPSLMPPSVPAIAVADQEPGVIGWLQVLGSFFMWFNSWGFINSYGLFQSYYQTDLLRHQTPSQIAWIGSIQSFLLLFVGVLVGPAYDAGYFRTLIWLGSFLIVFGYMMVSICNSYWQVILAQGLVVGVGFGCVFTPSMAILPQYFVKRRSLASGLAASGSGFGGLIYPIVFRQLGPQIGFGWTVRVLAFIALATSSVSLAVMRNKLPPREARKLFDFQALKDVHFAIYILSGFLLMVGLYTPIVYIQNYAIEQGTGDENLILYLIPVLNVGSIFGRIIPNYAADTIGPLNVIVPCTAAAGILGLCWIAIHNIGGLFAFAFLYGFFSGAGVSLLVPGIVVLAPDLRRIGSSMGTAFSIASTGMLIGIPITGAIINDTHKFVGAQTFAASVVLAAAVCVGTARISKFGIKLAVKA